MMWNAGIDNHRLNEVFFHLALACTIYLNCSRLHVYCVPTYLPDEAIERKEDFATSAR